MASESTVLHTIFKQTKATAKKAGFTSFESHLKSGNIM